ncbi:MAG: hypothetical protein OEO83_16745 [Alphaproteobacteria bacterium]|nr:hypothetical protein [Alphaproteobacteria bacterium]
MSDLPTFIVHDLVHTRAALSAAVRSGVKVRLLSAPGAAGFAGAGWFVAMVAAARAAEPGAASEAVLDCGREAGLALAAIRAGNEAIRLAAPTRVRARIQAIAAASGCRLLSGRRGPALDLLDATDPERAAALWLARRRGGAR